MKILFHLGHPAHFHLFYHTITYLKNQGNSVDITIKKKDVLENLLQEANLPYNNLQKNGRGDGVIGIMASLMRRDYTLYKIINGEKPDLMIGTSAEITHIGKLIGVPSISVNEDDWNVIPVYSYLSYPLANYLLAPECCNVGRWEKKTIKYNGYHELAYLHPKYFRPDKNRVKYLTNGDRYFIIRFAKLNANHDFGKQGISNSVANRVINILKQYGKVYITSERELEPEYERYQININPVDMHHVLAFADMYIGDSQTMAAEAAVLGTPSLRFNDFVGKISYLEELEHSYGLTFGFKTDEEDKLLSKIKELLCNTNLRYQWYQRKQKMLNEKIDVTAFLIWLIENFPDSVSIIRENPEYQYRFKL